MNIFQKTFPLILTFASTALNAEVVNYYYKNFETYNSMWNTPDGWLVDEDGSKVPASQYPNNSDSVTANIFMNGDYLANPINWKDVVRIQTSP